jgi:hypothetical protein
MGLTQSHVDQAIARPGPPPSPPRPSSSPLNPPRPSFLSYFIPTPTLDLTHDHLPPSLSDITEVADILARLLPPELVPRILDEAEYWTACRRMTKKHVTVTARAPSPREMLLQWRNGQEEELREAREVAGSGLKDGLGEVWYLVSPPIGCTQRPESPLVQQPQPESRNLSTEAGEGDVGGVEQEGPTKVWLRRVVLETLSKDQGWSTNDSAHTHYGESSVSLKV